MTGKRLVVARTNLRELPAPTQWGVLHGPVLAMVAHALAPAHGRVMIGSSYCYRQLHPWGSHPLLDPLWSSEAVTIEHDGTEADRVSKLRLLCQHPQFLPYLRVCWQRGRATNCGSCEKCLRTMLALEGLGYLGRGQFAAPLTAAAVRQVRLDAGPCISGGNCSISIYPRPCAGRLSMRYATTSGACHRTAR
ncbi:MAG: hypothetical protein ACRD7E_10975 [Bryobacteraceae bacterium]